MNTPNEIVLVTLTAEEMRQYAHAGTDRNLYAIEQMLNMVPGRHDSGFEAHIIGVLSEFALAKHIGVPYEPFIGGSDKAKGDVVGGYQVKCAPHGRLIVQKNDPEHFTYVLTRVVRLPTVQLIGWLPGSEAKAKDNWKKFNPGEDVRSPAYFVDGIDLNPMTTLPKPCLNAS